jgi:hypothetical protein
MTRGSNKKKTDTVNIPDILPENSSNTPTAKGYAEILTELKGRVALSRTRAAYAVNAELVLLYWEIGRIIVRQQEHAAWGDSVVERLSGDLQAEFPEMKGFSLPNIWRMRQFYRGYREVDEWLVREKLSTPSRDMHYRTAVIIFPETPSLEDSDMTKWPCIDSYLFDPLKRASLAMEDVVNG